MIAEMTRAQSNLVNAVLDIAGDSGESAGPSAQNTTGWVKVYVHAQCPGAYPVSYGMVLARRGGSLVKLPLKPDDAYSAAIIELHRTYAESGHAFGWFDLMIAADTRYRFAFGEVATVAAAASESTTARLERVAAACAAELGIPLGTTPPTPPPVAAPVTAPVLDTRGRFVKIVFEHFKVDPARAVPSARLVEDLGIGELDMVELMMALEEEFDLEYHELSQELMAKLPTVEDVVRYLSER